MRLPFLIIIFAGTFCSCGPSRYLEQGQILLHKNSINVKKGPGGALPKGLSEDVSSLVKQEPNERFFRLFRIKMRIYNTFNRGMETRFRWWMKRSFGEPPVIYDSTKTKNSANLMSLLLANNGFFDADVQVEENIKKQKIKVSYYIYPEKQYVINVVNYPEEPYRILQIINKHLAASLLIPGEGYNSRTLDKERSRIANDLRNGGYYYFTKKNIAYEVDSSLGDSKLNIWVKILESEDVEALRRYKINRVFLFPENSICRQDELVVYDTLSRNNIMIITSDTSSYKWDVVTKAVFLRTGQANAFQTNYNLTLSRLLDLGIFDFVNITLKNTPLDSTGLLDCFICLTPGKKQLMSIEIEGNTGNESRVGTALKYTYQNKNLSRGAEIFTFKVHGGIESQLIEDESFFNTIDVNAQSSLILPKFLLPFPLKNLSQRFNPKTTISTFYNFQQRPDITLTTANLSFGYNWKESKKKRHIVTPIAINYLQADAGSLIKELIESNPLLKKSLEDQLVVGGNYTFIYNDQSVFNPNSFWFFRGNFDIAGNTTKGINKIYNAVTGDAGNFKIFGLDYRHFIKLDVDLRRHVFLGKNRSLVFRLNAGVGSGLDSSVIPYVKQFYVGGSNSMRAWRVRTLGPGSFESTNDSNGGVSYNLVDQTGNVKLEQNIEYRFTVYKFFKAALFIDAGNIWTVNEDTARAGSKFSLSTFMSDYGIGAGAGARLDFSFFIVRLDLGLKIRDPSFPLDERWLINRIGDAKWNDNNLQLNDYPLLNLTIAINYPF